MEEMASGPPGPHHFLIMIFVVIWEEEVVEQ